jgi:hypothetical protein
MDEGRKRVLASAKLKTSCAELLNGTLLDRYRVDHPRFRGVSEFVSASD